MKCPMSWGSVLLAALLHAQFLRFGGAVSLHKGDGDLRAALESRTEELSQQKNIAHGLELSVRELQSELQSEKKALAVETEKEHTLQDKLNNVRAALDDSANNKRAPPVAPPAAVQSQRVVSKPAAPPAVVPAAVPVVAAFPAPVTEDVPGAKPVMLPVMQPVQAPAVQPVEASPEAMPEPELESPEELAAQQAFFGSSGMPKEETAKAVVAPRRQVAAPIEEPPSPTAHARQTTAQEPPPFFEAAAIQAASSRKSVPVKHTAPAAKADSEVKPTIRHPAAHSMAAAHPPAKQAAPQVPKARREARRAMKPKVQAAAAVPLPAPAAVATKDTSSGADFDALEAQLHEEDRRIQDLDSENNLDAMADGGLPAAPGSPPVAAAVAAPANKPQQEQEAPMDDLVSVEAPSEAAPEAAADAPDDPAAMALITGYSKSVGMDGARSDNKFLSQMSR